MGRTPDFMQAIMRQLDEPRQLRALRLQQKIEAGPPPGSEITIKAWRDWHRSGYVVCPGEKRDLTCHRAECGMGFCCAKMMAKGLLGTGEALPRADRPMCGAKTRVGGTCRMRVEAGKHRCKFHGGLSTGPKTDQGRERIAEAQRRRWAAAKQLSRITLSSRSEQRIGRFRPNLAAMSESTQSSKPTSRHPQVGR